MSARLTLLTAILALSCTVAAQVQSAAGPGAIAASTAAPAGPVEFDAKHQFLATINATSVYVRSGAGENYYPVMKLDKGAQVVVVGMKFDWLKIVPPEGAYSLIAKAFVAKDADGNTGTVLGDNVRVRAGSNLSNLKTELQTKLSKGAKVQIVGEVDEYYQIKPPPDAFVYIHQKFADPVRELPAGERIAVRAENVAPATQPVSDPGSAQVTAEAQSVAQARQKAAQEAARIEAEFDRIEAHLKGSLEQPLDQQPLTELIRNYDALLASEHLPANLRRIAEVRLIGLRAKLGSQQELLATRRQTEEALKRIDGIKAEQEPVQRRLASGVQVYTAVGLLQASTLQVGQGTLYRVTDPDTQRTICYARSSDPKFVQFTDKFVGVRGELVSDSDLSLKVVNATDVETVDPAKVNRGITAQIVPPSMVSKVAGESASTGNN